MKIIIKSVEIKQIRLFSTTYIALLWQTFSELANPQKTNLFQEVLALSLCDGNQSENHAFLMLWSQ